MNNIIQYIKNLFRKGEYTLTGQKLNDILEHPKVNLDPAELERINTSLAEYRGEYPKVKYLNSANDLVERDFKHINIQKHVSRLLAGLVFNEQSDINISDKFKEANEFIDEVFNHNDFKSNLNKYLEPMYALGGLTVRPYVNMNTGKVEFSWALADAFYPLTSTTNGISEGVMVSSTTTQEDNKTVYYTLLEFHEWEDDLYKITNELYKSKSENVVGQRVPLNELYDGVEETTYLQGLSRPLFNYVTPYGFNNINPHSPLGLGIADNSRSTISQINSANDEFHWEVKMGQRKVFVSDTMLRAVPDERNRAPKQVFDPDVNVYKGIRMGIDEELVKDVTSDIRADQYITTINHQLKTLEMELGFSQGTLTFDGKSMKTATEVVSENNQTYRTRNNHAHEVEIFIKGLIISVLELATATVIDGKQLFNGEIPTFNDVEVDFDDGVFQDRPAMLRFYGQAKAMGLVPTVEVIQKLFSIPEEKAKEWMALIDEEQGMDPEVMQTQSSEELFGLEE